MKIWILFVVMLFVFQQETEGLRYAWKHNVTSGNQLANRIRVPTGYVRTPLDARSFGNWLRNIPLRPGRPEVLLYNGQRKANQAVHEAVIDIDVSKRDLQQCADAVMRLRAEYLFSIRDLPAIHFNFTNGFQFDYPTWRQGGRVKVSGRQVNWAYSHRIDTTYSGFRAYMEMAFAYCGTASLAKELVPVKKEDLQAGDVFILPGSPGHAVIVMDVARHAQTGEMIFLLAQSYMPAQDMHVLKNLHDEKLSPWYSINFGSHLETPEWTFTARDLKRFR